MVGSKMLNNMDLEKAKFNQPKSPQEESPDIEKEFYAELTDPRKHDPKHFCYIVHALNPSAKNNLLMLTMMHGGYNFSQEVDLLGHPEDIVNKKLISTSIINQNHQETWGGVFYILDVPWGNFVKMSPHDRGTNINNPDFELEWSRPPYTVPSKLIEQSQGQLNEVVVTGKKNDQKVKIVGVGIKLTDVGDGEIKIPQEAEQIRKNAKELGVPAIELVEVVRIEDGEPEVSFGYEGRVRAFYINRDGYRYIFEGSWDKDEITDIFKGDKNFYGGHNPVTKKEWLVLRPIIESKMDNPGKLNFLKLIDKEFGV